MGKTCTDCGKPIYWEEGHWACSCPDQEDTLTGALQGLVEAVEQCGMTGQTGPMLIRKAHSAALAALKDDNV